jgi:hypothetical protein
MHGRSHAGPWSLGVASSVVRTRAGSRGSGHGCCGTGGSGHRSRCRCGAARHPRRRSELCDLGHRARVGRVANLKNSRLELLPRRVCHATDVGERPPVGPQRVEHLVNLTADVDRLVGGRNRLREFRLAKPRSRRRTGSRTGNARPLSASAVASCRRRGSAESASALGCVLAHRSGSGCGAWCGYSGGLSCKASSGILWHVRSSPYATTREDALSAYQAARRAHPRASPATKTASATASSRYTGLITRRATKTTSIVPNPKAASRAVARISSGGPLR